jgi:hypothetical protein
MVAYRHRIVCRAGGADHVVPKGPTDVLRAARQIAPADVARRRPAVRSRSGRTWRCSYIWAIPKGPARSLPCVPI